MTEYLEPEYDGRKSFYKKAEVKHGVREDGKPVTMLYSYDLMVAMVMELNGQENVHIRGTFSATTLRHIREFLMQFTKLPWLTKKEIQDIVDEGSVYT